MHKLTLNIVGPTPQRHWSNYSDHCAHLPFSLRVGEREGLSRRDLPSHFYLLRWIHVSWRVHHAV